MFRGTGLKKFPVVGQNPDSLICRCIKRGVKLRASMKTLYLLRHAKSSWDEPSLADFERPLSERGSQAAPFMGGLMRDLGFLPYVILSSPAVRAKTTAQMVKDAGTLDAEIRYEHRIYEASPQRLREVIAEIDNHTRPL